MKYILIEGLENEDMLDYINKIESAGKEEITLFIESDGGSSYVREMLVRMLEGKSYHLEVFVACSNALILLDKLASNAKSLKIHKDSQFMAHLCFYNIKIGDENTPMGVYEKYKTKLNKFPAYKFGFLNQSELEKYKNGENVWVDAEVIDKFYKNLRGE